MVQKLENEEFRDRGEVRKPYWSSGNHGIGGKIEGIHGGRQSSITSWDSKRLND
jgi:hypothetical protein